MEQDTNAKLLDAPVLVMRTVIVCSRRYVLIQPQMVRVLVNLQSVHVIRKRGIKLGYEGLVIACYQ